MVFLDELIIGMDFVVRRYLWNVLISVRDIGRILVFILYRYFKYKSEIYKCIDMY